MHFHRFKLVFIIFLFGIIYSQGIYAQETKYFEGVVTNVVKEELISEQTLYRNSDGTYYQELEVKLIRGVLSGETIVAEVTPAVQGFESNRYVAGDKVMIFGVADASGGYLFYVTDYQRRDVLLWLFLGFVFVVVLVSRLWGLASLAGLAFSFYIIFKFVLPNILAGYNPVLVAIVGALIIAPVTFYASHGFNKKTNVALFSTFIALIVTALLAVFFVDAANLTGFASEEALFLQIAQGSINIKGVLLAGIIIGTLGILDDVTVSQASIVVQLKNANPSYNYKELYFKAMHVGHDHIAATINTLVLVYTGAAMPLLLLFVNNPQPFVQVINNEIIADEIIRTLVGSIGLIFAIPVTTALAAYFLSDEKSTEGFYHTH